MVAAGTGLAAWGVASASVAGVEVDRPASLVTTGAFAVSRNPMYQGWSIALCGLGIATRSAWIIGAAVLATAATHRAILDEESRLSEAFGGRFTAYTAVTPRYLGPRRDQRIPVSYPSGTSVVSPARTDTSTGSGVPTSPATEPPVTR